MPSEHEENDTLHYAIMKDPDWSDLYWIVLTNETSRGPKAQILWNVLELLACLMFQTLPAKTFMKWLPLISRIDHPDANLNIKCPIGPSRPKNPNEYVLLNESSDPWVRSYVKSRGFRHISAEERANLSVSQEMSKHKKV